MEAKGVLTVLALGCLVTLACLVTACGGDPHQISRSGVGAYESSLTPLGHGLAAAWYDTRNGNAEIYARVLNSAGRPTTPERRLTFDPADSYEPDIIAVDRDIVVAWYDRARGGAVTPRLGRWTRAGERRWHVTLAPDGRNPVARLTGSRIFTAWIVNEDERAAVWMRWWSLDGQALGEPARLADASVTTWNLNAAVDPGGRPWLVFDARVGTQAQELFAVAADSGAGAVRLTSDDGMASAYPDIAFNGSRVAITWFDERDGNKEVYLGVVASGDLARPPGTPIEPTALRVTRTAGESIGAYLAWNGSRIGLAWSDQIEGQHEVFFQSFDDQGRPQAQARRLTNSGDRSLIPSIRAWGGSFALAWNEYAPGADPDQHGGGDAHSEIAFSLVRP